MQQKCWSINWMKKKKYSLKANYKITYHVSRTFWDFYKKIFRFIEKININISRAFAFSNLLYSLSNNINKNKDSNDYVSNFFKLDSLTFNVYFNYILSHIIIGCTFQNSASNVKFGNDFLMNSRGKLSESLK